MAIDWSLEHRTFIDLDWLDENRAGRLPPDPDLVAAAQSFVLARWRERASELGKPEPADLCEACNFSAVFVREVFGGRIDGNYDHRFNVVAGQIVDLNADAADVRRLGRKRTYRRDRDFLAEPDFHDRLRSCIPRVTTWVEEFVLTHTPATPHP